MNKFKHLTPEQRYQIEVLNRNRTSQTKISAIIGVNKNTISSELQRNIVKGGRYSGEYRSEVGQNETNERHKLKKKRIKFIESLKEETRKIPIEDKLSPELITATWKKQGKEGVCYETLYNRIFIAKKSSHWMYRKDRDLYKKSPTW